MSIAGATSPTSIELFLERMRELDIRVWLDGEHLRVSAPAGALSTELRDELRERRDEIRAALGGVAASAADAPAADGLAPLSPAQERIWFFAQLEPQSTAYNMSVVLTLQGTLDLAALEGSLSAIVARHAMLRTTFTQRDGSPRQQVHPPADRRLDVEDVSANPAGDRQRLAQAIWRREAERPFDLSTEFPLRVVLVRVHEHEHHLVLTVHHIAADGGSLVVFMRELVAHYAALRSGTAPDVPRLAIQYADYASRQRSWLASSDAAKTIAYWTEQFSGELPVLDLPTDYVRPPVQTFRGAATSMTVGGETSAALRALSRRNGCTLFMTMLAAFNAVLFRHTGDEDIIVGAPMAGRDHPETRDLVGLFINTLAFRTDLSGNPTFEELLGRVRNTCLKGFANQELPFARLLETLRLRRDLSRTPLFQVMFNMFSLDVEESAEVDGLRFAPPAFDRLLSAFDAESKFDLTVYARDAADGIRLTIVHNTDLFSEQRIESLRRHFLRVLDVVARDPLARIGDIALEEASLATPSRVPHRLRRGDFARIGDDFTNASIPARFREVVARQPDATAIVSAGDDWTYARLGDYAARIAELIQAATAGAAVRVGLLCEHDAPMIGAILGVLEQGSAYVPLDPGAPEDRLSRLLEDASVTVLLAAPAHLDLARRIAGSGRRTLSTDAEGPRAGLEAAPGPESVAYVLYTSGSSGQPKGIWQNHQNVLHYARSYVNTLELSPADRLTLVASYTFDASIVDIFSGLLSGATLFPIQVRSAGLHGIAQLLRDRAITVFHCTPTLYRALATHLDAESTAAVRCVVLGGEKVHPQDFQIFREHFADGSVFVNLYGASEVTIASMLLLDRGGPPPTHAVPIGSPIDGIDLVLLDADGRPSNVRGEIAVTSRHVALGYWNAPELSAGAFTTSPADARIRTYRTGDLARRSPDGRLEFLGRKDQQVKILGARIEPGEIETALANHPDVHQVAVTIDRAASGDPMLIAFVVLRVPGSTDAAQLKSHLRRVLPEYMVPAAVVVLDAMPLTRTGKIDRRALPAGQTLGLDREEFIEPRNAIEELLAEIWREVLGVDSVGVRDNFFALGGNSLNATQVLARLQSITRVSIPLRTLFTTPTIEAIAAAMEHAGDADGTEHLALEPHPGDEDTPLSFSQERMWFLQQVMPGNSAYNMSLAVELRGALDRDAFEESLRAIVARHQPLRAVFPTPGGVPRQQVVEAPLPLIEHDLRHLPAEERMPRAAHIAAELAVKPFDLEASPPWWVMLIRVDDDRHVCTVCFHHIVSDLWSFGVFFHELSALYNARVRGAEATLPTLGVQYGDFARWQHQWFRGRRLEAQLEYWKQRLAGVAPLELPTDRPRPPVATANGDRLLAAVPPALGARLRNFSVREGVTPFMTLLAAFNVLLSRYSGQTDIAVGVPIANRTQVGVEGLIGTFVNTLVHRNDLTGNPTFREVLKRVRGVALDAYSNQDLPFDQIVRALAPERDASRSPVFQVLFNLANAPLRSIGFDDVSLVPFVLERRSTQFDLVVNIALGQESAISTTFNSDLFDRATVEELLANYLTLLDAVTRAPDQPVARLPLLSADARRAIVVERNATAATYPGQPVTALVSAQAARTPDAVAVEFENTKLTYAELDARATRLAHHLRRRGVTAGSLVGVCLNRNADIVVALLAVLKTGAAYVPIDPNYPSHRVQFMLEDSGAAVVVTHSALLRRLPETSAAIVALDRDRAEIEAEDTRPLDTPALESRAYVIYTSGSTGNPKGVQIPHRALTNFLWSMLHEPGLREGDSLLAVTTISFDIAGLELYLPLVCGATIVLAGSDVAADGRRLRTLLEQRRPTVMQATPATWRALIDAGWEGDLRNFRILCGGEAMPRELADSLLQRAADVWNVYGPTETTIWSTVHRVTPGAGAVSIGRPIANTSVYVLDANGQPVPDGVHGELYIGGAGVALGYLNRPELTESRFVPDPFANDGSRMYRTGDRARYRRDGTLEHLGRLDFQVKVRGYRIELGEIEAVLDRLPATAQSIVDVRQDRLVAYIVFADGQEMTASEIRSALRETLPDFMVPSLVVPMERLPLTPNGKVDRKALPDPLRTGGRAESTYVAPTSPMEILIANVWREMLGVERIGTGDNFFELGGHSLLSMRVVHEIHQRTGWRPEPRLLFFETLGRIAAAAPQA